MSNVLFCPDGLRLDGRMAPPLDEGDILPCRVFDQGDPLARGRDAIIRLIVGADDAGIENGGVQGREAERDERMEGWVDRRRRRSGIGECSKYGRCIGIVFGGVLG